MTVVRTYRAKNQAQATALYAQDAATLDALGLSPAAQSWAENRIGCVSLLLFGWFALLMGRTGALTVTYTGTPTGPLPPEPVAPRSWRPWIVLAVVVVALLVLYAIGSAPAR